MNAGDCEVHFDYRSAADRRSQAERQHSARFEYKYGTPIFSPEQRPWHGRAVIDNKMARIGCLLLQRDQGGNSPRLEADLQKNVRYMQVLHKAVAISTSIELGEDGNPDGIIGENYVFDTLEIMPAIGVLEFALNHNGDDLYAAAMRRYIEEIQKFDTLNLYPSIRNSFFGSFNTVDDVTECHQEGDEDYEGGTEFFACGETMASFQEMQKPSRMAVTFKPI